MYPWVFWAAMCSIVHMSFQQSNVPVLTIPAGKTVVTLNEKTTQQEELVSNITCTGDGAVRVSLRSVAPSSPCGACFAVLPDKGVYALYFNPSQGSLNYTQVTSYTVQVECTDSTSSDSASIEVRLRPNSPPTFVTPATSFVTATLNNTENVKSGGSVYQASCTDSDSDTLQYTMTTDPITSNHFDIYANGVIRAERDLNTLCRSFITFSVTCQDPYNPPVGPVSIQITLNGYNNQPVITGINYNTDVTEDTAVGTTLGTFTVSDDNNVNCQIFSRPQESLQYFDLTFAQHSIIVKTKLNYEQTTTRNTNLTVTCTDNFCTSSAAYLYVRLTDVNEPIDINPKNFILSVNEGLISVDPPWTPIDEDVNDDPTYTIAGGNNLGRFAINPTTGIITSTLAYDVDGGAMATRDVIVVQARDEGGHTSSTTVSLTILDINDNRPTFATAQSQTFTVDGCTAAGTSPGFVAATDADSDYRGNNVLTYSGSNGPLTVSPSGTILVGSAIAGGTTYTVDVVATDAGEVPNSLASTTPARVSVTVTKCNLSETLTPLPNMPQPSQPNTEGLQFTLIALVAILGAAVLMTLMGVIYFRKQLRPTRQTRPTVQELNVITRQGPPTSLGSSSDYKPRKQKLPVAVPAARGKTWYSSE